MPTPSLVPPPPDSPIPAADDQLGHTTAFFAELIEGAPEDHHALLWTLQNKKSTWVPLRYGLDGGPSTIVGQARRLAETGNDVYVAVSLAGQPGLHDTRIQSGNAAGIFGLWADLDIADPNAHKKWNLPPTVEAAMELLDMCELEPTMVVHSGHGLQAWWLFKEFWRFDSETSRLDAAGLAQRWNATLQSKAAERSWVVDSTYDLARVMRVPGTLNRKADPVVPVLILSLDGPRYEPEDIEALCVDPSYLSARGLTPTRAYVPDAFELTESNKPDYERLQALLDNDSTFQKTYDMKRREFSDQSPSSYDLSLATQAARAGWSDKEIAALMLAFRRRHRLDVSKALRRDYVHRTLAKARDGLSRDDAAEAIDEVGDALDEAKASGDPEREKDARRATLDVIGQQLGIEIVHILKYMSDPAQFALVTPTKTIFLGGNDGILTWAKFKAAVWESVGEQIPRFKAPDWDRITSLIPKAWEEWDVGAEATEWGETTAWLAAYLSQRPPVDTVDEAAASEYPYVDEQQSQVIMFGSAFRRWLYLTYQERITNKEMGRRLRAYGCAPDKISVDEAGRRTSRGVWRLPSGAFQ